MEFRDPHGVKSTLDSSLHTQKPSVEPWIILVSKKLCPIFSYQENFLHSIFLSEKKFSTSYIGFPPLDFIKYWRCHILLTPLSKEFLTLQSITILHPQYILCSDYQNWSFIMFGKYSKVNMKLKAIKDKC